jgi:hypothetical protein
MVGNASLRTGYVSSAIVEMMDGRNLRRHSQHAPKSKIANTKGQGLNTSTCSEHVTTARKRGEYYEAFRGICERGIEVPLGERKGLSFVGR